MIRRKIWRIKNTPSVVCLEDTLNLSPLTLQLLVSRGIDTSEKIRTFLACSNAAFHPPLLLQDMGKAVERILKARSSHQKILLYGDYDVDGITSVALVAKVLNELDIPFVYYHPDRLREGYGFHLSGLEMARQEGASLIIAVDCGTSNPDTVEAAKAYGIEVIIVDHHQVVGEIPRAIAVINPRRADCFYPFKELAGVGVALKLAQAIFLQIGASPSMEEYLEIAALGTVVDVVPLIGENRVITKLGLEAMMNESNLGILAIRRVAGLLQKKLTCGQLGFQIGPRLNAAGRLIGASKATELLLSLEEQRCAELAMILERENEKRRTLQEETTEQAIHEIETNPIIHGGKVIVVSNEGWHPGIVGLVASYLQDMYHKPAVVISTENGLGHGSARSISEFHIFNALKKLEDLFIKYGGHRLAAGLTLKASHIGLFREKINQIAEESLTLEDLIPKLDIDLLVDLGDLNSHIIEELDLLEPFGYGNPAPLMAALHCRIRSAPRRFGVNGNHLKFGVIDASGRPFECLGWNMADREEDCKVDFVDIAFRPSLNEWNGNISLRLELKDVRPNQPAL